MTSRRTRFIAAVCVAALLLTAFVPALFAIEAVLAPVDSLFAMVPLGAANSAQPQSPRRTAAFDSTPPRAPPAA